MKFVIFGYCLALALVAEASVSMHNEFYCYATDLIRPLNEMHATLTSYEAVRRSADLPISTCSASPSRFWMISRHGGRLPAATLLQQMIDFVNSPVQAEILTNYNAGRTTLCAADFELFRNWVRDPNITVAIESMNTEAGWRSMNNIGRRYQERFPDLLQNTYSQERYLFRHADTQRSLASISAFAGGIFGDGGWLDVVFEPIPDFDTFLRPLHFCQAFTDATITQYQQIAFAQGPEVRQMVQQINDRLGLRGSTQWSLAEVLLVWEWCRFETGSTDGSVPAAWCTPFSMAHHEILEYYRDIAYYHFTGYGTQPQRLVENMNCHLIQDMLNVMQSTDANDRPVRIYSSFSQIVQAFLVALGAFRDERPLNQHNFAHQTFRHWRSSVLTPNAANLVIIRYDCADGDHDLVFLLNERPFVFPGCRADGICKLSAVVNRLQRFVEADCEELFCSTD